MRIINQRRDISLNFDQINVYLDGETIYTVVDGKTRILGRYANAERAMKVFMEMHQKQECSWYIIDGKSSIHMYIMPEE